MMFQAETFDCLRRRISFAHLVYETLYEAGER